MKRDLCRMNPACRPAKAGVPTVVMLLACVALGAGPMRVERGAFPLCINPAGEPVPVGVARPRPENVTAVQVGNNIQVSWDAVPGAKCYRVYSAICLQDTTFMVSYASPVLDPEPGAITWLYRGSFWPRYGDVYTEQYVAEPREINMWNVEDYIDPRNMRVLMWGSLASRAQRILLSGFEFEAELWGQDSTTYVRPLEGRDRMFRVSAVW